MFSLEQSTIRRALRAALYLRVSGKGQSKEDRYSLPTQEDECRAFTRQHGWSVAEEHVFREVYSGEFLWERPELTRLRELIRRHEIDVVVIHEIDRLSRDPVHLGVIITEAEHHGVEVYFVLTPLDNTPEGQLIRFVRGYAAKIEHEKIKERTQRGLRARIAAGKPRVGFKPLYGHRWNAPTEEDLAQEAAHPGNKRSHRRHYVLDEATAPIVRRIFIEVVFKGRSLRDVARQLTAEGIPVPSGQLIPWRQTTIAKILHHPGYMGKAYAHRYVKPNPNDERFLGKKLPKQVLRDEKDWIALPDGTIPPIVDERTWKAAQLVLLGNRERAGRSAHHPEANLLRGGIAICGYCGAAMHAGRTYNGKPYYYCGARKYKKGTDQECEASGTILAEKLDAEVSDWLAAGLRNPKGIVQQVRAHLQRDHTEADLASHNRALADVTRKQSVLIDHLADLDPDSADAVKQKLAALSAQRRQLEDERQQLIATSEEWRLDLMRLDHLEVWCQEMAATLDELTYEERRLTLAALNVRIKVYRADYTPRWEPEAGIDLAAFANGEFVPVSKQTGTNLLITSCGRVPLTWAL